MEEGRALWHLHGGDLDAARVRLRLHHFEQALRQGGLVSAFEDSSTGHPLDDGLAPE